MLLDSNIIIYSAQPENEFLRQLLYDLTLVTRNVDDFIGIDGLRVLNPFAAG